MQITKLQHTLIALVGVEFIPKEIRKFINDKSIITNISNIFRIQAYDSVMCGYFWISFLDFMVKGNSLKVVSATFLLVCFLCLEENTFEIRKENFYFTSKALFVLEIIRF